MASFIKGKIKSSTLPLSASSGINIFKLISLIIRNKTLQLNPQGDHPTEGGSNSKTNHP